MNIKPKQYAIALFESLKDAKDKERKDIIDNFVFLLKENNDISKAAPIMEYFKGFWMEHKDTAEAEVISAYDLDKQILNMFKGLISKRVKASNVLTSENKDKSLLGGAVIRYEDKMLDMSLRRKLEEFKRNMVEK